MAAGMIRIRIRLLLICIRIRIRTPIPPPPLASGPPSRYVFANCHGRRRI